MYINPKVQALPSKSFLPQHRSQILKLLASLSLCDSENMPNPSQVTPGQLPTFSLPCQDQTQRLVEGAGASVTKAQRPTNPSRQKQMSSWSCLTCEKVDGSPFPCSQFYSFSPRKTLSLSSLTEYCLFSSPFRGSYITAG